jgi:hypothetical protein
MHLRTFVANAAARHALRLVCAVCLLMTPAAARAQAVQSPEGCAAGERACAIQPLSASGSFSSAAIEKTVRQTDVKFQIVTGAFVTAAGSDIAMSMYQIGKGNAREAGFGRWWQGNPTALAVSKSAMVALFAYELQQVHKENPKLAFVLGIAATAVESALVVRSAGMRARIVAAPGF